MEREVNTNDYGLDRLEVVKPDRLRFESQRSSVDKELHRRVIAQNIYSKQIREIQKPVISNQKRQEVLQRMQPFDPFLERDLRLFQNPPIRTYKPKVSSPKTGNDSQKQLKSQNLLLNVYKTPLRNENKSSQRHLSNHNMPNSQERQRDTQSTVSASNAKSLSILAKAKTVQRQKQGEVQQPEENLIQYRPITGKDELEAPLQMEKF